MPRDTLRRVMENRFLRIADKEPVRYKSKYGPGTGKL
jgi:hypothetical protein